MLEIAILEYQTAAGRRPFADWLYGLRDLRAIALIHQRLERLRIGHFGHARPVGDGVWELKVAHGPGYRIYYLVDEERRIILLAGGDKGSQERDIERARRFAEDYWRRK